VKAQPFRLRGRQKAPLPAPTGVSAAGVPEPQNVRYGWKKWFIPTLFNREGLPASPFRTDDFPPATKDRDCFDRS
jgi:hypothetical protein